MKSTTLVLGAFLAAVAIAQPHKQHLARHHHNKRANAETTVIVTDWVYEYETVGVTTTIWVSPGYVEPEVTSSSSSSSSSSSTTTTTSPKTTTTPEASSTTSQTPAQFFEPVSTSTTQEPAPSTTSTTSSSTSTSVYVAPTTSTTSSVYVPPIVETSNSIPVSIAPVETPTTTAAAVVYTPPAETTTAAPAATTSNTVSSSSSSSGVCSSGSPCTGDITYYEAGLGACGTTNDGSTEKVVALPHGLMGTQSNGNPYCGKTITVSYGGKTTTATVVDKCMGCEGDSIDLSNAAFLELAELAVGRASAQWWFN